MREVVKRWWVVLLEELAGILVGIVASVNLSLTVGALLLLIAFWAVFTGFMEIIAAIRLRREIDNEWSLILSGVLSVILFLTTSSYILLKPSSSHNLLETIHPIYAHLGLNGIFAGIAPAIIFPLVILLEPNLEVQTCPLYPHLCYNLYTNTINYVDYARFPGFFSNGVEFGLRYPSRHGSKCDFSNKITF